MKIRCPHCGGSNTAKILYGLLDGQILQKLNNKGEKYIPGGCIISGDDPAYKCLTCNRQFGKPPVLLQEDDRGSESRVFLPEVMTGVEFSIGGCIGGTYMVKIVREDHDGAICSFHIPDYMEDDVLKIREFSGREWKRLTDKLFNRLFIHEWEDEYCNNVSDGTQWELILYSELGEIYKIYGSNKYPPLFDTLSRMFRYYMHENMPEESDPAKRALYKNIFRENRLLSSLIHEHYERLDQEAVYGKAGSIKR